MEEQNRVNEKRTGTSGKKVVTGREKVDEEVIRKVRTQRENAPQTETIGA